MKKIHALTTPVALGIVILDQIIKNILISKDIFWFEPENWFSVAPSYNVGIAFSLPFPRIPLIVASAAIIALALVWWKRNTLKNTRQAVGMGLFVGGALSNMIDRIWHGLVIDYINIWTGALNIADLAIITGIILLIFSTTKKLEKEDIHLPRYPGRP
tara:strand:+ start:119 stop:592 length:474 start_codon:yes stop_codon:yes gene_type:complete